MIRAPPSRVRAAPATAADAWDAVVARAVVTRPLQDRDLAKAAAAAQETATEDDIAAAAVQAIRDKKAALAQARLLVTAVVLAPPVPASAPNQDRTAVTIASPSPLASASSAAAMSPSPTASAPNAITPRREAYYLDLDIVDPTAPPPLTAGRRSSTAVAQSSSSAAVASAASETIAAAVAAAIPSAASVAATRRRRVKTVSEDSIRSYLYEIGEVKLLDADAEIHLARDIAKLLELERLSASIKESTGRDPTVTEWAREAHLDIESFRATLRAGLRAKERMVAANLRLVVSIAKKYLNRGLTFQDLIQEGSIGLIRGAEKFDADKGFKFSTYATWWIRQAITRAIADHSRPIRLPVHVNDTIAAIKKVSKTLYSELNRTPTEAEIADRMQLPVEKLRFLARSSRTTISLETPIGRDGKESSATLGSFIVYPGDTPEESTMQNLLREDLENVLNSLTPRERDVVRMRYGFDDGRMKTLEEIGILFSVTRERIRQIESKALRKLRHPNRNACLREWIYE
jgi:RNA polymerase primary sigma factor